MSKDTQSPVVLRWETQPIDNKENIKHKILEIQKKTEKLQQKSMNSDGDIKITKKLTSTGAIPKYFGEITNNPIRQTKLSRRRGTTSDSLTNNQIDNKIYTKTKFEIFDEHNVPCAHSTTIDDNRHEAFRKAKEFFENGTQDNDQFDIKKKKFIKINESPVKKQLKHQRIRQLINEEKVADDGVTPHDVGPPELDKVKLLHKKAEIDQECPRKLCAPVNYRERDFLYLDDFVLYQLNIDQHREFPFNYRSLNASIDQRQTVVQFIIRVCSHNALPCQMIYQAVRIFDDMLQAKQIPLKNLQLIMITCLWIVLKKDYIAYRLPSAEKMASFSDNLYTPDDIFICEIDILKTLNFNIIYPEPISLLCACIWSVPNANQIGQQEMSDIYYCGCYMIDLATIDDELIKKSALLLAVTAAELATTIIIESEENLYNVEFNKWRSQQGWLLLDEDSIFYVRNIFIRNIVESCYRGTKSHVVYKKFLRSRYGKVSQLLIRKIQKLLPP